jgi:hypothetical protein
MVDIAGVKTNYTGPYISDGKFQSSVAFGSAIPTDKLDMYSRLHDSAFAKWNDYGHLAAANAMYHGWVQGDSVTAQVAGNLVLFGNQTLGSLSNLFGAGAAGVAGLLYGGVKNALDLHDYMLNEKRYKAEVSAYYATDPFKGDPRYDPFAVVNHKGVEPGTGGGVGVKNTKDQAPAAVMKQENGKPNQDSLNAHPRTLYNPTYFPRTTKQTNMDYWRHQQGYSVNLGGKLKSVYGVTKRHLFYRRKGFVRSNIVYVE